jgi:hypothetical protein
MSDVWQNDKAPRLRDHTPQKALSHAKKALAFAT